MSTAEKSSAGSLGASLIHPTVIAAIISGLVALTVAYLYTQSDLNAVKDASRQVERTKVANLPVGSIVASLLEPSVFREVVGDPSVHDPKKSQWTLAAGQDVGGSEYTRLTSRINIPDLRGIFLRGVNGDRIGDEGDPDGKARAVGSYQPDKFESHQHAISGYDDSNTGPGTYVSMQHDGKGMKELKATKSQTDSEGDATETRPRNVAVYYYIKIN